MSIRLMSMVWEIQLAASQKSVLLVLADHARDDGSKCYPTVGLISWKTEINERTVQRILHDLKNLGIIEAKQHEDGGRGYATEYQIHLDKAVLKTPLK